MHNAVALSVMGNLTYTLSGWRAFNTKRLNIWDCDILGGVSLQHCWGLYAVFLKCILLLLLLLPWFCFYLAFIFRFTSWTKSRKTELLHIIGASYFTTVWNFVIKRQNFHCVRIWNCFCCLKYSFILSWQYST